VAAGQRCELTPRRRVEDPSYDLETAYGHIAIGVEDLDGALASLKGQGIEPEREPYRVTEGGSRICFVRDPNR
jgi:lactoylglutathione lyase